MGDNEECFQVCQYTSYPYMGKRTGEYSKEGDKHLKYTSRPEVIGVSGNGGRGVGGKKAFPDRRHNP